MTSTRKEQLDQIERYLNELTLLKAKIMAEIEKDARVYHTNRMDRYKALECHFISTDYPNSTFRWSTSKKDTIKLELRSYQSHGRYEGGLYETGPSFKLIVGLLQAIEDASHKRA